MHAVCNPCTHIGFELWQVKAGTIFDDIIVSDSMAEVDAFVAKTFTAKKAGEKAKADAAAEAKKKADEEAAAKAEADRKAADEAKKSEEAEEDEEL